MSKSLALPSRCSCLFVCKHFWLLQAVVFDCLMLSWLHQLGVLDCLVVWSGLVNAFDIILLALLAPRSASGPRQNLSTNRLRTSIWSSTRTTLDHLATTRSFARIKLLGFWLNNSLPPLSRVAMAGLKLMLASQESCWLGAGNPFFSLLQWLFWWLCKVWAIFLASPSPDQERHWSASSLLDKLLLLRRIRLLSFKKLMLIQYEDMVEL